jgi:hypothetical protein
MKLEFRSLVESPAMFDETEGSSDRYGNPRSDGCMRGSVITRDIVLDQVKLQLEWNRAELSESVAGHAGKGQERPGFAGKRAGDEDDVQHGGRRARLGVRAEEERHKHRFDAGGGRTDTDGGDAVLQALAFADGVQHGSGRPLVGESGWCTRDRGCKPGRAKVSGSLGQLDLQSAEQWEARVCRLCGPGRYDNVLCPSHGKAAECDTV